MTHGQRLLRWRESAGASQAAMARRMGITRQAYSRYEADAAKMTEDRVAAACLELGISVAEYYGPVPARRRSGVA